MFCRRFLIDGDTMTSLLQLNPIMQTIRAQFHSWGLTPADVHFELVDPQTLELIKIYGGFRRYPHWSFGKEILETFYQASNKVYFDQIIYEHPCRALLSNENSLIEHIIAIAHLYAHADFYQNNRYITSPTKTSLHLAEAVRICAGTYGQNTVEQIIDAARIVSDYPHILSYISENSPHLTSWQRRLLILIHKETLERSTIQQTALINEGWATYWHSEMIKHWSFTGTEAMQAAKFQAQVLRSTPTKLNPYWHGQQIFRMIDKFNGDQEKWTVRQDLADHEFLQRYASYSHIHTQLLSQNNTNQPNLSVDIQRTEESGDLHLLNHSKTPPLATEEAKLALLQLSRLWDGSIYLHTALGKKWLTLCNTDLK